MKRFLTFLLSSTLIYQQANTMEMYAAPILDSTQGSPPPIEQPMPSLREGSIGQINSDEICTIGVSAIDPEVNTLGYLGWKGDQKLCPGIPKNLNLYHHTLSIEIILRNILQNVPFDDFKSFLENPPVDPQLSLLHWTFKLIWEIKLQGHPVQDFMGIGLKPLISSAALVFTLPPATLEEYQAAVKEYKRLKEIGKFTGALGVGAASCAVLRQMAQARASAPPPPPQGPSSERNKYSMAKDFLVWVANLNNPLNGANGGNGKKSGGIKDIPFDAMHRFVDLTDLNPRSTGSALDTLVIRGSIETGRAYLPKVAETMAQAFRADNIGMALGAVTLVSGIASVAYNLWATHQSSDVKKAEQKHTEYEANPYPKDIIAHSHLSLGADVPQTDRQDLQKYVLQFKQLKKIIEKVRAQTPVHSLDPQALLANAHAFRLGLESVVAEMAIFLGCNINYQAEVSQGMQGIYIGHLEQALRHFQAISSEMLTIDFENLPNKKEFMTTVYTPFIELYKTASLLYKCLRYKVLELDNYKVKSGLFADQGRPLELPNLPNMVSFISVKDKIQALGKFYKATNKTPASTPSILEFQEVKEILDYLDWLYFFQDKGISKLYTKAMRVGSQFITQLEGKSLDRFVSSFTREAFYNLLDKEGLSQAEQRVLHAVLGTTYDLVLDHWKNLTRMNDLENVRGSGDVTSFIKGFNNILEKTAHAKIVEFRVKGLKESLPKCFNDILDNVDLSEYNMERLKQLRSKTQKAKRDCDQEPTKLQDSLKLINLENTYRQSMINSLSENSALREGFMNCLDFLDQEYTSWSQKPLQPVRMVNFNIEKSPQMLQEEKRAFQIWAGSRQSWQIIQIPYMTFLNPRFAISDLHPNV
jgi:hypothetical protein